MADWVRALTTITLMLGATSTGCGQHPDAQNDDGDSGSDTSGGSPAECQIYNGIRLFEGYQSHQVVTALRPASQGGTNAVTGSCGGGGNDHTYLVTSEKTAYYDLFALSNDHDFPLTFHIHAGDSCHGPELYCATAAHHNFTVMLAEGETVTMVVDTEVDLAIPEDGLHYNVGVGWGDPPCVLQSLNDCNDAAADALEVCMPSDTCGDFQTAVACHATFADDMSGCSQAFCPSGSGESFDNCVEICANRRSNCNNEEGCDAHTCAYEGQMCMDTCSICNEAEFDFEFAGECELTLPGPPLGGHDFYVSVEVGGFQKALGELGTECGDPRGPGAVWTSDSVLLLCAPACEAYAIAGVATVRYGPPPCEW